MLRPNLIAVASLILCGCEPTQNEKTASAMVASLEAALKGQPLTVIAVQNVFKASEGSRPSDEGEVYIASVRVQRVGTDTADRDTRRPSPADVMSPSQNAGRF